MSRTRKAQRGYIDRIIEIRKVVMPGAQLEVYGLGDKLGVGTFRSVNHEDLKVMVQSPGSLGSKTDWKTVAQQLAIIYDIRPDTFARVVNRYTTSAGFATNVRVTVAKDSAKKKVNQF